MCRFWCGYKFLNLLSKYLTYLIVGSYGKSMFSFVGSFKKNLPKWLYRFAFLPKMYENFYCSSSSSPVFGAVSVVDIGHSNRCVIVSHYWDILIYIYLKTYDVEPLFLCIFVLCIFYFMRCLLSFGSHFSWVVCFHIIEI